MKNSTITTLELERFRLGELPNTELARLESSLGETEREQLQQMDRDDAQLLSQLPTAVFAAEIGRRVQPVRTSWGLKRSLKWSFVPALVAASAEFLVLHEPPPTDGARPMQVGANRAKGDFRLLIYRRQAAESILLQQGDLAQAGDALQLGHLLVEPRNGVIVSLDGNGAVTRHWPDPGVPAQMQIGKRVLDFSYHLDDAPKFERFVMVYSESPIDIDTVIKAAKTVASGPNAQNTQLELPKQWKQVSTTLLKSSD